MRVIVLLILLTVWCTFRKDHHGVLEFVQLPELDSTSGDMSTRRAGLRALDRLDYARLNCGEGAEVFSGLEEYEMSVGNASATIVDREDDSGPESDSRASDGSVVSVGRGADERSGTHDGLTDLGEDPELTIARLEADLASKKDTLRTQMLLQRVRDLQREIDSVSDQTRKINGGNKAGKRAGASKTSNVVIAPAKKTKAKKTVEPGMADVGFIRQLEDLQRAAEARLSAMSVTGGALPKTGKSGSKAKGQSRSHRASLSQPAQGQGRRRQHGHTGGRTSGSSSSDRNRGRSSSYSAKDSEYSGTSSDSSDSDTHSILSGHKRSFKTKHRGKGRATKSGRSRRAGDSVVKSEVWPQAKLSLQYAGRRLKYDELSMPLFVAGFIESLDSDIKRGRTEQLNSKLMHLKSLMYAASYQDWDVILELNTAIVSDIERGHRQWGDSTLDIESRVFSSVTLKGVTRQGTLASPKGIGGKTSMSVTGDTNVGGAGKTAGVMFCRQFQSGKCNKPKSHIGFVNGKRNTVTHICATCWLVERVQHSHSEASTECKYHGKSLEQARKLCKE